MKQEFSVTITARGEGLDYCDEDGLFRFNIGRRDSTVQFHVYNCSDETFQLRILTEKQLQRIIPRIVAYLQNDGSQVQVLYSASLPPLR
jgi:hypothetical protein